MSSLFDNSFVGGLTGAAPGNAPKDAAAANTGTCFEAGGLAFTSVSEALVEVLEVPEVTPIGGTAPWFLGLAVYRAELLPVTDFAAWAGLSTPANTQRGLDERAASARLLVVERAHHTETDTYPDAGLGNQSNEKIGLLVDQVSGQVTLDKAKSVSNDSSAISRALREALPDAGNVSALASLAELTTGFWSSPDRVFIVELERLFKLQAFLTIASTNSATDAMPVLDGVAENSVAANSVAKNVKKPSVNKSTDKSMQRGPSEMLQAAAKRTATDTAGAS